MTVASGKRTKFVKIIRVDPASRTDFEERPEASAVVYEGWVHIRPASGREIEVAASMEAHVTHAVEMDYPFVRILPDDEVVFKDAPNMFEPNRRLNIEGVINVDEANRELRLMCREVIAG